jgi:hypothetical protein
MRPAAAEGRRESASELRGEVVRGLLVRIELHDGDRGARARLIPAARRRLDCDPWSFPSY